MLEAYLQIPKPASGHLGGGSGGSSEISAFQALVEAYGASGHEENVRKAILNRLDPRLQKKTETDAAGNLILHLGLLEGKSPHIAFVAHMDEIGYEAKETFLHAGGELLHPCPCLNDHPAWIEAMRTIVTEEGQGWL